MLITNTLLLSGALYAYVKQRRNAASAEIVLPPENEIGLQERTADAQHYAAISSLSLGLSVAGAIATPTIGALSIPLNVYTNLPLFEEAFATLNGKDDKLGSIILSLLISSTLMSDQLVTATLIDWVVQRSRLAGARLRESSLATANNMGNGLQKWVGQALGGKPDTATVVHEQTETEVPFAELNVGDVVLFREREFVSVSGRIINGAAQAFDWSLVHNGPLDIGIGDQVKPRMMLLTGALHVQIEQIA